MKNLLVAFVVVVIFGAVVSFCIGYFVSNKLGSTPTTEVRSTEIQKPRLLVIPTTIIQGEPVMIQVTGTNGLNSSTTVKEIIFAGKKVSFHTYNSKPTFFIGIALAGKVGVYNINAKLTDGTILKNTLTVSVRSKVQAPLGIPQKLGGNTTSSQTNLVNTLVKENSIIKALTTTPQIFWDKPFQYPIKDPIITDPFGYTRLTGAYTITHLGVDLRADEGTPVAAMNRGLVTFASTTVVYGNMIVIDHGFGIETLYAHLSKINIIKGQIVERGQIIGQSGQTGYADQPHLHVSVKINKISIDPIKFLNFFK